MEIELLNKAAFLAYKAGYRDGARRYFNPGGKVGEMHDRDLEKEATKVYEKYRIDIFHLIKGEEIGNKSTEK